MHPASSGERMILSDRDLRALIERGDLMIRPLEADQIRENGIDLRIGHEFARLRNVTVALDTRRPPSDLLDYYMRERTDKIDGFVMRPHEHVLLHTLEYVALPRDIMGFVNLRSTFARLGLFIPPTIIDAGFRGQLTIEVVGGNFPVKIYPGQRFLHIVFAKLSSEVEKPYRGVYSGQLGVQLPVLPVD